MQQINFCVFYYCNQSYGLQMQLFSHFGLFSFFKLKNDNNKCIGFKIKLCFAKWLTFINSIDQFIPNEKS